MYKNLVYPEQSELVYKKDYGICYSGGGLRSCVLTYGSMGEILDKLDKVKYISGVSGSTWFIVLFMYYTNQTGETLASDSCTKF